MHPNITPTTEMTIVCEAAAKAAARNTTWQSVSPGALRGSKRSRHRKIISFNVTFGGGTYQYYLSVQGYLYEKQLSGYAFLKLPEFTSGQLIQMSSVLNTIAI